MKGIIPGSTSGEEDDTRLYVDQVASDMTAVGVEVELEQPGPGSKDPDFDKMQAIGRCFEEHDKKLAALKKQHEEALQNLDKAWKTELASATGESELEAEQRAMRHQQHLAEVQAHSAEELYKFEAAHLEATEKMYREIDPTYVGDDDKEDESLSKSDGKGQSV